MPTEFGWWRKDPEEGKFQVVAAFHGGNLEWQRKQGHHTSWEDYDPTPEDWDRLLLEVDHRFQRRLLSPKQVETIRRLRPANDQ